MWQNLAAQWHTSSFGRWHQNLGVRERILTDLTAFLILLGLVYLALWRPIVSWSQAQQQRYEQKEALLEWMQLHSAEARQQNQNNTQPASGNGSLLTVVSNTAREEGVQLTRFQPEGNGGVSVVLQNQNFDLIVRWLGNLQSQHNVQIRQISVDRQEALGSVNVRINFL